jgi:hypothetical protein
MLLDLDRGRVKLIEKGSPSTFPSGLSTKLRNRWQHVEGKHETRWRFKASPVQPLLLAVKRHRQRGEGEALKEAYLKSLKEGVFKG